MPRELQGFSRDFTRREAPCIGIFSAEGAGKTRLCATAGEWAAERNKIPGWIVCDRKTRKTVRETIESMGLEIPYINKDDFISQKDALALATNEDHTFVQKIYVNAVKNLFESAVRLGEAKEVEPIIFDSGTQLWDWIAYSHFGRKQNAGKARVWGPPKQDWIDLMDGLSHKTVLITLRSKEEWVNKTNASGEDASKATGKLTWDGPPHLGFTTTSVIRLNCDPRKLKEDETYVDRFSLDVVESQDNKGQESVNGVLLGESITFSNLISILRPEE